jgi:hypothetical protein
MAPPPNSFLCFSCAITNVADGNTGVFSVFCPVRDVADSYNLSLLFSRDHVGEKAQEDVEQGRHHGRRNGRKKRKCRRPFTREAKFPPLVSA